MTNDLIQYLITEANELLDCAASGDAGERQIAEAQEFTALASRLLERRDFAVTVSDYKEAA